MAQPVLYGVRPLLRVPKPVTGLEVVNLLIELAFDALVFYFLGLKSLIYFLFGTILGLGLHPISGHFISGMPSKEQQSSRKSFLSSSQSITLSSKASKPIRIMDRWTTWHSTSVITMNVRGGSPADRSVLSVFLFDRSRFPQHSGLFSAQSALFISALLRWSLLCF